MDDLDNQGELLPVKRLNSLTQILFSAQRKAQESGSSLSQPLFLEVFYHFLHCFGGRCRSQNGS